METSSSHTSEERRFPKSNNVLHDNEVMVSVGGASCLPNQVNGEEDENTIEVTIQVHANKYESMKKPQTSNKSMKTRSCSDDSIHIETLDHGENKTGNPDETDKISVVQETNSTASSQKIKCTTKEKIEKNIRSYKSTKEHKSIIKALVIIGIYLSFTLILVVINIV